MSETPTLAIVLQEQRDRIVARFVNELQREELSPAGTPRGLLIDHIPKFLDELGHGPSTGGDAARQHGEQRWAIGYDLPTLVREYTVLRRSILQTARDFGARPTEAELELLADRIALAVGEATDAYVKRRDEELQKQTQRFEFLAEAGKLLTSSLDYRSTTSRLTGLVVPRMADWCMVHVIGVAVDDMPIAHVDPSKRELLRDLVRLHPATSASAEGFLYEATNGGAQLVADVDEAVLQRHARSADELALMRDVGTCSFLSVPLRVQDQTFGGLLLGYSSSRRRYDESDLELAEEIALRAANAIDNARLYALSQEARSRAEAATRAKDEFVSLVSHELRTPLNAILGWVRLLRSSGFDPSKTSHALDIISRNAEAQNRLVDDLIDISRLLTGNLRMSQAQVDLATVVELAIEAVRPAADAKRITLTLETVPDTLLRGDGQRLQQVAWNLVANAVKFTPKGGDVRVRITRIESDLLLSVEDTGVGVTAEFLPHVFEIFRQSETGITRSYGGLGIGLSIAKHITELHGGVIELTSAGHDKGTTATVRLPISPLVSTTAGVSRVAATSTAPLTPLVDLSGIRVLVVEDDEDARELLDIVLRTAGAEVRFATSVTEAMANVTSFAPHVLCSDLGLAEAEEDGFALIRRIRSIREGTSEAAVRTLPAIALTARGRPDDRSRALVEGFNRFLAKPVEPAVLLKTVYELAHP